MDIVEFLDKTWQEIPVQDNPSMHHHHFTDGYRRPDEVIMIFKDGRKRITQNGFVVAYVPLEGDIINKGVFWTSDSAKLFAQALSAHANP